jgi:hypothetical protein
MNVFDLEQILAAVDPAALLVPPRILRRVIKHDSKVTGIGLQVPHRKCHVIGRAPLLDIVDRQELGLPEDADLADVVMLLEQPAPEQLAVTPPEVTLLRYWRLLFHCRIHLALAQRFAAGILTNAGLRRRIQDLGRAEFDEAERVLRQEKLLLPPADERTTYIELAAVYLELRHFAPSLVRDYFPSIDDLDRIDALLAEDLDAEVLFTKTRLPGAAGPAAAQGGRPDAWVDPVAGSVGARQLDASEWPPSEEACQTFLQEADRAAARGNCVRSAILMARAAAVGMPALRGDLHAGAVTELQRLSPRLQAALALKPAEAEAWRRSLPLLLEPAAGGLWPVEARLLYDLQKVCIDHEREVYAVDLVEWGLSLGKRPVKRPLPHLREVLIVKHLRKAARRLAKVRLANRDRDQLAALLQAAVERSEQRLRERLRPQLIEVFDRVSMQPRNYPERVGRDKVVEELLDGVTERGFLNFGDLRDAVSRNNLKLPDLAGPAEFFGRDRLLRVDRQLARVLDGVYHRAEIYLRWLQRFSSLAFGTPVGRFVTRYFALPFGGAFVAIEGIKELYKIITGSERPLVNRPTTAALVGCIGLLLLGLLYVPGFRRQVGRAFSLVYRGLRFLLVEVPASVIRLPVVQGFLRSRPMQYFRRHLLAPLIVAGVAAALFLAARCSAKVTAGGSTATFLAAVLLFNSRLGRTLEEILIDWLIRSWYHLRTDVLPGMFRWIMDLFKGMIETVERFLYSVDEWLRFKSGEGRFTLAGKAVLGVVWFYVTYVVRFAFNVLIEPQINPIKHFPVVTVSHKLLLPTIPSVGRALAATMDLDLVSANGIATTIITSIPGVFGFLVWELKENWKLYEANRPATLRPVVIGHHGETMLRLLRPGIHSGTLPKLYARLRKAQRRAVRSRAWRATYKQRDAIHHVAESVQHFIERDFVRLLQGSKSWGRPQVAVGRVEVGSNRIRVEICCPALGQEHLRIGFTERGGWLVGAIEQRGWLTDLAEAPLQALRTALAGLYKLAGVQLVREEIEACFNGVLLSFDIGQRGLLVWLNGNCDAPAVYDLASKTRLLPHSMDGARDDTLPVLAADGVLYQLVPLTWDRWVAAWEQDQFGKEQECELVQDFQLLPPMGDSHTPTRGPVATPGERCLEGSRSNGTSYDRYAGAP